MADPYWRYGADRASLPGGGGSIPSFPGYLPSGTSTLPSHHLWSSSDLRGSSSDILHKDISTSRPGAYGVDDIPSFGVRPEPGIGGFSAGVHQEPIIGGFSTEATFKGYSSSLDDKYLLGRRDASLGIGPGISEIISERPDSLRKVDGLPVASRESNVLFVDGLPDDCSRREVSHLFRPFIGFSEIRVVHKEPRHLELDINPGVLILFPFPEAVLRFRFLRIHVIWKLLRGLLGKNILHQMQTGEKAKVLCFVEFSDSKCALTALEALQGYKFDIKKPESPVLRIQFAHFPFRLPSDVEEPRLAVLPR